MFKQVIAQPTWSWLCLGGLALVAELLGVGGYLLWSGIAAIITAFVTWLIPEMNWNWQGLLFAITIILSVLVWRKWLIKLQNKLALYYEPNKKQHQLIGIRTRLIYKTNNGYSRVQLAGSNWRIYCSQQLSADTEIEVINIDGITLIVKPICSNQNNSS